MEFGLHPLFVIAAGSLVGTLVCLFFACLALNWSKRGFGNLFNYLNPKLMYLRIL